MRVICLAFLLLLPTLAQELPDAVKLLEQSKRAMQSFRTYQFESKTAMEITVGGQAVKTEMEVSVSVVRPAKVRVETTSAELGRVLMVSDGEHVWFFLDSKKQFTKANAMLTSEHSWTMFAGDSVPTKDARVTGEETLDINGEKVACWVVERKVPALKESGMELQDVVLTEWIDQKLGVDRQRIVAGKMKAAFAPDGSKVRIQETRRGLKVNESLPDSLFQFIPPEGVREVADYAGMMGAAVAGRDAPTSWKVGHEGLKGKLVLLDFSTPGCVPCQNEGLVLSRIEKEGALVVLHPADAEMRRAFSVQAFPTYVLIGRDGKIAGQKIGAGEEGLRTLLALAEPKAPVEAPAEIAPMVAAGEVQAYVPNMAPVEYVQPVAPPELKDTSGRVQLLVTIDGTGKVTNAEALNGPKELQQAALDSVKKQRYRPVIRAGHPVSAYTDATMYFLVKGKPSMGAMDTAGQMAAFHRLRELTEKFPRSAAQVLADEEGQSKDFEGVDRFYALDRLAKSAFTAGAPDKATAYANELLLTAPKYRDDWNYGNAIHDGNLVLGMLAVRQGNVSAANQYLLEAGNTPGSPQLNSFGPDTSLAKALLEKGEKDSVLEYFSRCRKFWMSHREQLDAWSAAVKAGETPDLRFNAWLAR